MIANLQAASETKMMGLYEQRMLERVVQIFLKDHSDLYIFTTKEQLELLQGFDVIISKIDNQKSFLEKVREQLVGMTLKTVGSSDKDLYNLMRYYLDQGILETNEYLMATLREYLDQRFDVMDRDMILKYCELLKDFGMFFEDHDLIIRL